MEEWKKNIRDLIAEGKIEKAIEDILQNKHFLTEEEIIQIEINASRHSNWKDHKLKGMIDNDTELRNVENSVLEIISSKNTFNKIKTKNKKKWKTNTIVIGTILLIAIIVISTNTNFSITGRDNFKNNENVTINNIKNNHQTFQPVIQSGINSKKADKNNTGVIFVNRKSNFVGYWVKDLIEINNQPITKIDAGETKIIKLPEGNYTIEAKLSNGGSYGNELQINLKNKDTLNIEISHTWKFRPQLKIKE